MKLNEFKTILEGNAKFYEVEEGEDQDLVPEMKKKYPDSLVVDAAETADKLPESSSAKVLIIKNHGKVKKRSADVRAWAVKQNFEKIVAIFNMRDFK